MNTFCEAFLLRQRQLPPLGPKTLIAKQLDVHAQSDCKAQTAAANPSANGPFALDPQRVPIGLVELFLGICTLHVCLCCIQASLMTGAKNCSTSTEDCVARHFAQAFGQHQLVPKHEFQPSTSRKLGGCLLSGLVHV